MEKEYEHNGHKYWVKIEPAVHSETNEAGFVAYVNDEKPGGIFYGTPVRDHEGRVIFFRDQLTAVTNANAVKQSELGKK